MAYHEFLQKIILIGLILCSPTLFAQLSTYSLLPNAGYATAPKNYYDVSLSCPLNYCVVSQTTAFGASYGLPDYFCHGDIVYQKTEYKEFVVTELGKSCESRYNNTVCRYGNLVKDYSDSDYPYASCSKDWNCGENSIISGYAATSEYSQAASSHYVDVCRSDTNLQLAFRANSTSKTRLKFYEIDVDRQASLEESIN